MGIIDAVVAQTMTPGQSMNPPPLFRALVDTGAQRTMISANVASAVGLSPIGKIKLQGIGKRVTYHNGYLFNVAFVFPTTPMPGASPLPPGQQHLLILMNTATIHGGELSAPAGFDVLLGMDIISTGSLHIEGNGTFSFSM